jgi:hypothetical protein
MNATRPRGINVLISKWKSMCGPRPGISALLVLACAVYIAYGWVTVLEVRSMFGTRPFRACFSPGLVETVQTIRERNVPYVFGPPSAASSYVFQRFSEMLYPISYYPHVDPQRLAVGDLYVLFADASVPVSSSTVCSHGPFRLMEVQP